MSSHKLIFVLDLLRRIDLISLPMAVRILKGDEPHGDSLSTIIEPSAPRTQK